jgi:hypothetical protein
LDIDLPLTPTSDPGWLLTEDDFTLAREHEIESILAIGNGYVGTRASLDEGSPLSWPATFAAGIYVDDPASNLGPTAENYVGRVELVARLSAPGDPGASGESMIADDPDACCRAPARGHDCNRGRIDPPAEVRGGEVWARAQPITQGSDGGGRSASVGRSASTGQYPCLRLVTLPIRTRRRAAMPQLSSSKEPRPSSRPMSTLERCRGRHCGRDDEAQQALRFAVYHPVAAAGRADEHASIGARGLTGEGYRGHVFWDTEIYVLPFYVFTDPPADVAF